MHIVAGGIGRKGVDYIYIFLLYFDPMDVTVLLVDMNIQYPGNFCVFETTP